MLRDRQRSRPDLTIAIAAVVLGLLAPAQAALADRYVLSTTTGATLGGIGFANEDAADYDPVADTAVLLFDGSAHFSGNEDIDAIHVLANGHIVLSTTGNATLGTLAFNDDDLVDYDPTTGTAVLLFDGGSILTNTAGDEDIDAVHVLPNGHLVFSTRADGILGGLGFADEDLVDYDPITGTAAVLFDGSAHFSADENVDAVHLLPNGHIVLSTTGNANLGTLAFNDDDLVDYDPITGTALLLFDGGARFGSNEDLDAAHVIPTVDHFAITHDGSAETCTVEPVTITKHDATHAIDTTYSGTINLSTTTSNGDWSLLTGSGVLLNAGNGAATYAFDPADSGQVVLGFRSSFAETLNIDVSDGTDSELASEDPDLVVAASGAETFRDEFNTGGYSGSDGTQGWATDWIERDDDGTPTGGNVTVTGGELALDDNPNTDLDPSAEREADLSSFAGATFSFDFRTLGGIDPNDSIFIEVSSNGGGSWTLLENITGINDTTGSRSYDITPHLSANTRVRFRVNGLGGSGGTSCCYGAAGESFRADNVQILATALAVSCGADHFTLNHDGFGIHCVSEPIDLTPVDAGGAPVTGYAQTVVLDTQSGTGSWVGTSGGGILTDTTPNDGLASYAFSGSETFPVSFTLSYPEGPATFNIDVYDSGSPGIRDDDTEGDITFSPSGFTLTPTPLGNPPGPINPIPAQIAGRPFSLHLTAYGQTPSDPVCGVIETYDGPVDLAFWSTYDNPSTGTIPVTVNATPVATAEAAAGTQSIVFNQGAAQVSTKYKDVGRIMVQMKDEAVANPDLPTGIRGGTNLFVVKPATFALSNILRTSDALPNPGAADHTGPVFIQAGDDFSVTVTVLDDEGDSTPNYGRELSPEGVALTPAIVAAGAANNPPIQFTTGFGPFAGGTASGTDFGWHEVGIISLTPSVGDGDYLGEGDVAGSTSGNVGRFIPFDFSVGLNSPEFGTSCGPFTYLGQSFQYTTAPVITVTARSKPPTASPTQNYTGLFWKFTDAKLVAAGNKTYTAAVGAVDTGLISPPDPAIADTGAGTATLTFSDGGGFAMQRGAAQGPFDADISLSINVIDEDDVIYAGNPARFSDATPTNGIPFDVDKEMRWGRLNLENAHGSELLPLAVPSEAQYFDGSGFVTNADDNCSLVALGNLTLSNNQEAGQTDGDIIIGTGLTTATIGGTPLAAGQADLSFSRPDDTGFTDVVVDLSSGGAGLWWLQFDWDGDGNDDNNPTARATFGIFSGSPNLIHIREPWN